MTMTPDEFADLLDQLAADLARDGVSKLGDRDPEAARHGAVKVVASQAVRARASELRCLARRVTKAPMPFPVHRPRGAQLS